MIDGVVVVDKPVGWTSHDVVGKLRRVYGQKRIGHAGTLDPDATGVLVVGLGRVTRLLRFVTDLPKSYRGTVVFGVATDTLDASGEVLDRRAMPLEPDQVEGALERFRGKIDQLPPMVSAVKVGGKKLYEAARRGEHVDRSTRTVTVHRIELESFVPGPYPEATLLVDCSSGTYVRALAADLGTFLGGCAHLRGLRRLQVGAFTLDPTAGGRARSIEEIEADPGGAVLSPSAAVAHLPTVTVEEEQAVAVRHGAVFAAPALVGELDVEGPLAVLDTGGALLAVYERDAGACRAAVVLG